MAGVAGRRVPALGLSFSTATPPRFLVWQGVAGVANYALSFYVDKLIHSK